MKKGKTLEELGAELSRQRKARKDFIADTRKLLFQMDGSTPLLLLDVKGSLHSYMIGELAEQQIAARLQIPYRYYQRMKELYPELLKENVNGWLHHTSEKRMIRTLDGHIRAFLSDRYRRLDHLELCTAVLPIIREMKDAEIKSCEITEEHMYIKVVNRSLKADIQVGDAVQAGFVISNSEVGLGSLRVEPLVYRLICRNGLIAKDYSQKKYHVGKQIQGDDSAYELYSDETLKQDDKVFFMKVQDTVKAAVDEVRFHLLVDQMKQSIHVPLQKNVPEEVKELSDRFALNEEERLLITENLFRSGDHTHYGLLNAVTAAGKKVDSYERATYLERVGGDILSMLPSQADDNISIFGPGHIVPFSISK